MMDTRPLVEGAPDSFMPVRVNALVSDSEEVRTSFIPGRLTLMGRRREYLSTGYESIGSGADERSLSVVYDSLPVRFPTATLRRSLAGFTFERVVMLSNLIGLVEDYGWHRVSHLLSDNSIPYIWGVEIFLLQ